MRGHIIRKILVVLIILAPVFSYSGCRKQATVYFDYFYPASVG